MEYKIMKIKFTVFYLVFISPTFGETANMCGVYYRMYAVPKSFTCLPGQFLPANAYECVLCPDGYTCSGGTYTFNSKKAQGLVLKGKVSANTNNTCAVNTGHVMNGYWIPNTITINWDDGTNSSTSQCVFGTKLVLPPEPVRPGYKFGGWRVKNN